MQRAPFRWIVVVVSLAVVALVSSSCAPDGVEVPTEHSASGLKSDLALKTNCASVTSLSASPLSTNLGAVMQLSASGVDSSGSSDNVQLSWAVTAGPGTGTLGQANPTASQTLTCTGAGALTVSVTASSRSASPTCPVSSQSITIGCTTKGPASVSVTPKNVTLTPGAQQRFAAVMSSGEARSAPLRNAIWSSSDAHVAAVDGGVVTALATGVVSISALDPATGLSGGSSLTVTCPAGFTDCNGHCVDVSYDPKHCGSCAVLCSPGQVCSNGVCCGAGQTACPDCSTVLCRLGGPCVCPETCMDLASDLSNCGSCGNTCPAVAHGSPTCAAGSCDVACDSGFTRCGGATATCIDTSSDANNCGGCGVSCPAGQSCVAGLCNWTPLPGAGCYQSAYPNISWTQVPCRAAPPAPLLVGKGTDQKAMVAGAGATIGSATGSFSGITGLTIEQDWGNPWTFGGTDDFSLQENTNFFSTSTPSGVNASGVNPCAGNNCVGVQQFALNNFASFSPYGSSIYIQFWLKGYHKSNGTCPTSSTAGGGWAQSDDDCYINSPAASVPIQTSLSLGGLRMAATTGVMGLDTVMLITPTQAFAVGLPTNFLGLNGSWNFAEFNVFGMQNSSQAVFNAGTTMTVSNALTGPGGGAVTATCATGGITAETNNLNLACPCFASGGTIMFTQSNASSPTCTCPASALCGGTTCCRAKETCMPDGTCCGNAVCNGVCCPNPQNVCDPTTGACSTPCPGASHNCALDELCCFNQTPGQTWGFECDAPAFAFPWCGESDYNLFVQCDCPAGLTCTQSPGSGMSYCM